MKKIQEDAEEQLFLHQYNPKDYDPIALTVDTVVFGITKQSSENYRKLDNQSLNVLLIKRKDFPYKDVYSLPGGFVGQKETLEQTAARVLEKKTGLKGVFCEQLYTFSEVERDPRMRVISCAYISLIDTKEAEIDEAEWLRVDQIKDVSLAFDHNQIIMEALKRLRGKLYYSDIVFHMMPELFTISELQKVYEIILGEKILAASFRRYIADKVEETEEFTKDAGHRPSRLFRKKEMILNVQ